MRIDVGPVAPASAVAWMEWADEALGGLDATPASRIPPPIGFLGDAVSCLRRWMPRTDRLSESFRWQAEVDPDELEFLVHAFFTLDAELSHKGLDENGRSAPATGRNFYLVLVRALLHALETESPSRAAYVDQLRWSWPAAADAN